MGYLVLLLAGVGTFVLAKIVLKAGSATARVTRAVEAFQATSLEAFKAIHTLPADEDRQFKAVLEWNRARKSIVLLQEDEQAMVFSTLTSRGCQISEIVATIEGFMKHTDQESCLLDTQLAEVVQNS